MTCFYLVEPMPRFYNLPKWRVFAVDEKGKYTPRGQFWKRIDAEDEAHRRNMKMFKHDTALERIMES